MKHSYKKGQVFGGWTLEKFLGGGGNGEVWLSRNSKGETGALKLLKRIGPTPYKRFVDETTVMEQNSDVVGIIPIIDKHLPVSQLGKTPYFVMPIAESSEIKLRGKSILEKIDSIIEVAETLSILHSRNIFHRDIKPANILYYNSRFSLADFGLVDYPNKQEVSLKNEEIGAKWTMAPEMRRESSKANAAKADVYSLAKTLWIYLTDNKKGFDGQYSTESIIHLKKFYPGAYTTPIDNLLIASTDNDPLKRPSVDEFIAALLNWKELVNDFHEGNQEQWFEIQTRLFPTSIPTRVVWENANDIIKVLKVVSMYSNLNHMFFPNGGGLDLEDARQSFEEGCIELDFQLISIVKPKRLIFESFGFDHEWNYFRLELDELAPSGVYEVEYGQEPYEKTHEREQVSELEAGYYADYFIMEDPDYYKEDWNITPLSRRVTRWFRGNFVIFSKSSPYNQDTSTYDGRHNKMSTDEFRKYIDNNVERLRKKEKDKNVFDKLFDKTYQRQVRRRKGSQI